MTRRRGGHGLLIERTLADKAAAARAPVWLAPNAAGNGPAEILALVGDRSGRVMGELDAELVGVAWKLNDYGQARFGLPRRGGATATERLLRPGNRILIQFGNGLPDWGGVLDLPRKWQGGRIEPTAYSGERLLMDRITDRGRYFNNAPAGEIFRALLVEAAEAGVEPGQIWLGGGMHGPDYHLASLYNIYTRSLIDMEAADWDVTPGLAGGRIFFRANFYQRKGRDHGRRLALIEGVNLVEAGLQEQGPIVNEWQLAGAGTGWGAESRIYATAADAVSQAKYGLRQRGEVRVDVSVQATLDGLAASALAESKEIRAVAGPTALDRPPARWKEYGIGDRLWMELYEAGFGGVGREVRVRAREFLPGRGVCAVVVE